jgi:3-oxoacyl-[acyl-carrier-protein] synthase II
MTDRRRVVVTGVGVISPVGLSAEESWEAAKNGRSGVGPITLFDPSEINVRVAGEVKGFDPENYMEPKEARRRDRYQWFGFAAAKEAVAASGLEIAPENAYRVGVGITSAAGGIQTVVEQTRLIDEQGPRRVDPFSAPRIMANGAASLVSMEFGARGPAFAALSACASANDCIGMSMFLIRSGVADAMIAGSADATIGSLFVAGLDRVRVASRQTDHTPAPFSATRDGLVMGEGGAVLVLEELEHARARGAFILAELAGYGATADAFHITAPLEDGAGAAKAMELALEDARAAPGDVSYVNAHGTGTILNDISETRAIKKALGARVHEIPVSSTKSVTGHMMGTTGAVEAIFCALAIRDNVVPPTVNYLEKDPECDLDYVPNEARDWRVDIAVSNAFGFGGHNAVLVIKRFT